MNMERKLALSVFISAIAGLGWMFQVGWLPWATAGAIDEQHNKIHAIEMNIGLIQNDVKHINDGIVDIKEMLKK
jgi:hypothetical protein